jgi:D-sedoheptulose 7-phosphate isomerase
MSKPLPSTHVSTYLADLSSILAALPREPISEIVEALLAAAEEDRTVYIFGNGGSAATASHLACDLVKATNVPGRPRLRAVALTDNVALLTAISNDLSYEDVFAEQLRSLVRAGDVVIAISASGNSPNVIEGVTAARAMGAAVIGLAGFGGGKLQALSDISLVVPSNEYGPVEDMHMIVAHTITAALKAIRGTPADATQLSIGATTARSSEVKQHVASHLVPTIFLDRDGVINRNRDDYVKSWSEFAFLPGACRAIARLSHAGYRVFVVTNQACVGKGLTSLTAVDDIHRRMQEQVTLAGGRIEAILLCPHRADAGCACRKPNPGLLLRARDEYGVDLSSALFIGDSVSDIRTAAAAGVPALLVLSGLGWRAAREGAANQPHVRAVGRDLQHAVNLILGGTALERAAEPLLRALAQASHLWSQARQRFTSTPATGLVPATADPQPKRA